MNHGLLAILKLDQRRNTKTNEKDFLDHNVHEKDTYTQSHKQISFDTDILVRSQGVMIAIFSNTKDNFCLKLSSKNATDTDQLN